MPGRQAHGRPLLANPNKKRKSGKGSGRGGGGGSGNNGGAPSRFAGGAPRTRQGGRVDVMALAEQQVTERRQKGLRVRDLEVEREQGKRRRRDSDDDALDDDDDEEGGGEGDAKRRRTNADSDDSAAELHSDSDGNEWREGVGSDDDDSEIDSDEAFGDSDDEMFDAFAFGGSASNQAKSKKSKPAAKTSRDDDDEFDGFDDPSDMSDEDVGDDGADLGDDAIDLAAALDIVSSDEDEAPPPSKSSRKTKARKAKKQRPSDNDLSDASDASSISGSDDRGSDSGSGSGGDSDGSDSGSSASSDFDSDDEDDSEEEEDEDAGAFGRSDALQSLASAYAAGEAAGDEDEEEDEAAAAARRATNPYQFSGNFILKDRSLKKAAKVATAPSVAAKTLDVPLLPMQQERVLRKAAAEKAHETLDRWTDTVKHNHRAEHLTFEVAGTLAASHLDTTALVPITHKNAQTDLEKTIMSIMEESGLGPRAQAEQAEKARQDGAGGTVLSPEALKALINQKRRAREQQSREQARAKRIKKIKSKAYRRIHRRERQRAEGLEDSDGACDSDGNPLDSDAEREAQHRRRALERMGARHRDSRWAKRAKNTNRAAWDDEFRAGLVDMARQDEELRRRIDGAGAGAGGAEGNGASDDESDDSYGDESDEEAFRLRTQQKLEAAGAGAGANEPKGIMGIAFMQKAEAARKKANDDAVAEILRDLNRGVNSDDEDEVMDVRFGDDAASDADSDNADGEKMVGRRTYGPAAHSGGQTNGTAPSRAQVRPERDDSAEPDGTQVAPVAAIAATSTASSGRPKPARSTSEGPAATASAPGAASAWTVVPSKSGKSSKKADKEKAKARAAAAAAAAAAPDAGIKADGSLMVSAVVDGMMAESRAAVAVAAAAATKKSAQTKKPKATAAPADDASETSSSGSDSSDSDEADDVDHRSRGRDMFRFGSKRQDVLLQALGDDGGEAEFAAEKARQAAAEAAEWEDQQTRARGGRSSEALPGWGSWVGEGVSKRAIKRDQRSVNDKARKDKKDGKDAPPPRKDAKLSRVIISERHARKNDKYLASQLPHEFETRNQYERSLRLPVGPEWSTTFAFQDATKPRVLHKQGVVLPMAKPQI